MARETSRREPRAVTVGLDGEHVGAVTGQLLGYQAGPGWYHECAEAAQRAEQVERVGSPRVECQPVEFRRAT
jgi:hypothetical protein